MFARPIKTRACLCVFDKLFKRLFSCLFIVCVLFTRKRFKVIEKSLLNVNVVSSQLPAATELVSIRNVS